MEIDEIKKFPALNVDNGIMNLVSSIKSLSESLKSSEKTLNEHIGNIQKNCQHVWKEKTRYDKNIASCFKIGGNIGYGMTVLESKTCILCGLYEKRPEGPPYKVCHSCWTPMEYRFTIPGQEERTFVHECQNPKCHYGSWHT